MDVTLKLWYQTLFVFHRFSGVVACRLTEEILPRILKDLLSHDMVKSPSFSIKIPKGTFKARKFICIINQITCIMGEFAY